MAEEIQKQEGHNFVVKWAANEYKVTVTSESGTVLCLKKSIEFQTGVKVERQKLLNLKFKGNRINKFIPFFIKLYLRAPKLL